VRRSYLLARSGIYGARNLSSGDDAPFTATCGWVYACRAWEDDVMKLFLIAASAIVAIAVSTPLWAQPAPGNPPPSGAQAAAPVQSANRMPAGGRVTSERGLTGAVERAHHRRHATHAAARASQAQLGVADQLNGQEFAKIQSGNQPQSGNPSTLNRMPIGGKATSGSNKF
jgi:hypothetical protein